MRILSTALTVVLVACLLVVFVLAWRREMAGLVGHLVPGFLCPAAAAYGRAGVLAGAGAARFQPQPGCVYLYLDASARRGAAVRRDAAAPAARPAGSFAGDLLALEPNLEFVPDSIELAITVPAIAPGLPDDCLCPAPGRLARGLYAILAMNLAVGALFAYAGIYYGGTLPFTAPGPNFVEVVRSLIPQYLATSAVLMGPLFAWRFRQAGLAGGRGGKIAYHLALAGLLLVIVANLAGLMLTMQVDSPNSSAGDPLVPVIILGLGVYLVGLIWLYRYELFPRTASGLAEGILLPLLPLGIPVMLMMPFISWKWPVSNLYGIPLLWALPHAVSLALGLVWLGLSVWVVTRGGETPIAASVEQIQMSTTSGVGGG